MNITRRGMIQAAVALYAATGTSAWAQKKAPEGVKVLLLSGGARQHHGYREQALVLSRGLEDSGRYEVTICEDGNILTSPGMAKYDVLIVHVDRRDPEFKFTMEQQQALLDFVRSGKGYVSIHGGDNAAPDWVPEWRDMLGGVFSHIGLPKISTSCAAWSGPAGWFGSSGDVSVEPTLYQPVTRLLIQRRIRCGKKPET